jgi:DNA-3-methyladenine glycosylase II
MSPWERMFDYSVGAANIGKDFSRAKMPTTADNGGPMLTSVRAEFAIDPEGPFSLEESATFGFGQREAARWAGCMRLAFCLEPDLRTHVGVVLEQPDGPDTYVRGVIHGPKDVDPDAVRLQVARVLSLDHDARPYVDIGDRDPVIAALQAVAPGLRPPLFYSPYEAAAWVVLSARRPRRQVAETRRKLSEAYGTTFDLAGEQIAALPTPERLLGIESFPGLPEEKVTRLHGVAQAALEGVLATDRLQRMGPEAANRELQSIRGIGPFYASLIIVRACGFVDVLPAEEPHLHGLLQRIYGLSHEPTTQEVSAMAEAWRPFRTWACVLVRAAGPRLLGEKPAM